MTVEAPLTYADVAAQRVAAGNAIEYAYREWGTATCHSSFCSTSAAISTTGTPH
jgi:hypothetical protein